jgi:DNA-binding response OmpR family regulator
MFSAKNDPGFVNASLQLGCNDVLPKPFAKIELLTKIHAHIKVTSPPLFVSPSLSLC